MSAEPTTAEDGGGRRADRGARRGLGLLFGLVVLAFKAVAYVRVLTHPDVAIWVFAVIGVFALLRARPITMCVTFAVFIALLVHPHPLIAELALAVGSLALLVAISLGIGLVLRWLDNRLAD